jgi:hypothetical protein
MKQQVLALALLLVAAHCIGVTAEHDAASTKKFTLTLSYAARDGVAFSSNAFAVKWNGIRVAEYWPSDYEINSICLSLIAKVGYNTIGFAGLGTSDGFGVGITSIKLIQDGTTKDYIRNGLFSEKLKGGSWNFYTNDDAAAWKDLSVPAG